jgi:hypothetical protein
MCPVTTAEDSWQTMLELLFIEPPGKFESTVKGLHMQHYQSLPLFFVTDQIRLGGAFVQTMRGPIPAALALTAAAAANAVIIPPPVIPVPGFVVPVDTILTPAAQNPNNWLQ